jgi:hypothetical protein
MTTLRYGILLMAGPSPATPSFAFGPRVDLNQDVGRADVRSPGWDNWRVLKGPSATAKFGGIEATLRTADQGGKLTTHWWKPGFDYPARMASDGVMVSGRLELVLRGLTPGRHSLATYHNALTDAKPGKITVAVRGGASVTVDEPGHSRRRRGHRLRRVRGRLRPGRRNESHAGEVRRRGPQRLRDRPSGPGPACG